MRRMGHKSGNKINNRTDNILKATVAAQDATAEFGRDMEVRWGPTRSKTQLQKAWTQMRTHAP